MRRLFVAALPLLTVLLTSSAQASFIMNVRQVGADVVATGSGSINLSGLGSSGGLAGGGASWGTFPGGGSLLALGPPASVALDGYGAINGPATFGSGGFDPASSGSGGVVALAPGDGNTILVPAGYISGDALSDSSIWSGQTIAGIGLMPGTYTYTWGTGANADSLTLNIGVTADAPEPSSVWLSAAGASMLLFRMRKRVR